MLKPTFRMKLLAIAGTAAIAFLALLVASNWLSAQVVQQLKVIENRHVPKVAAGPTLEAHFEQLHRTIQDAAAAQDIDALTATRAQKDRFVAELTAARDAIGDTHLLPLREAVEDYYLAAELVSRRLIAEDVGEDFSGAVTVMQAKRGRALDLLYTATAFNPNELRSVFATVSKALGTATQIRVAIGIACFLLLIAMTFWLSRSVVRSLGDLASAFERIGSGDFSVVVPVTSGDEIGALAEQANKMALNLLRLSNERDRSDWLKAGHAELLHDTRGDLEPSVVAERALRSLIRRTGSVAGVLYAVDRDQRIELLAQYAGEGAPGITPKTSFRVGEGLVGQAAAQEEIVVIDQVPADALRIRSGLCETAPMTLVLLPMQHLGKVIGVLELASFKPWAPREHELLVSVREALAIAIEVARTRAAVRGLLVETQHQAELLIAQEDELRATNEELQVQQEELRQTNEELTQKAAELETQRRSLERNNAELEVSRKALEQKATELTTVSAYKTQFLANMSHELRTPLNSMLLLSHLLSENEAKNLTAKQVEYCKTVYGAGQDLLLLINQVLDLAKIEAGRQETVLSTVALRDIVLRAERMYGPLARDKGLELTTEITPGTPESITSDGRRVEQIVTNLLGNAIKFTAKGSVKLIVGKPDPATRMERQGLQASACIALTVIDTGIGIAAADQGRIFTPFEQIDASVDRRYGGTGLGLTIARELTALLGGELQLSSTLGSGSCFVCYLPEEPPAVARRHVELSRVTPPVAQPTSLAAPASSTPAADAPTNGHALEDAPLLVIEDDPVFAEVLGDIIAEQGFRCLIATEGRQGLRLAKAHKPCGIVLDVKLSDIDGFQVLEALQGDPATASIPVHFVSATEAAERGKAMGAIGYLTKPATRQELVRVVESLAPRVADRVCKILIVEENVAAAQSLSHDLEGDGLEVHSAPSASSVIAALDHESFDCMVLDLALSDMDGLALLDMLQARCGAKMPPVVVYTGRALSKTEAQRLEAYTEAIVMKEGPATERLLAEIRLFVERFRRGLPARGRAKQALRSQSVHLEGRKVLIVDDDMRTVYALSALLRAKGVQVVVAENGRVALSMLDQNPHIEIVLMDLMMPEMDGYEAMQRIREDPRFVALPIVALTAKAMRGDREKCVEAGANDYLPKPIDPSRLFEVVSELLSHPPTEVAHGA